MYNWLGIALVAYLLGAAIEGLDAASQLSRSSLAPDHTGSNPSEAREPEAAEPPKGKWQVFTAIVTVSVCGAFLWPCRLLHRSLKGLQQFSDE